MGAQNGCSNWFERAAATSGHDGVVDRNLHRYWIQLKTGEWPREFGVTAYTETDALEILRYVAYAPAGLPEVIEIVADVDVRSLDQGHVVPNMNPPNWRGIWYPKGYDTGPVRRRGG
jgi:hypothetical protein